MSHSFALACSLNNSCNTTTVSIGLEQLLLCRSNAVHTLSSRATGQLVVFRILSCQSIMMISAIWLQRLWGDVCKSLLLCPFNLKASFICISVLSCVTWQSLCLTFNLFPVTLYPVIDTCFIAVAGCCAQRCCRFNWAREWSVDVTSL